MKPHLVQVGESYTEHELVDAITDSLWRGVLVLEVFHFIEAFLILQMYRVHNNYSFLIKYHTVDLYITHYTMNVLTQVL